MHDKATGHLVLSELFAAEALQFVVVQGNSFAGHDVRDHDLAV